MKRRSIAWFALALTLAAARADDKADFKDDKEKASYALGLNLAYGWKQRMLEPSEDFDIDALARGIRDASGETQKVAPEQIGIILNQYQQALATRQQERQKVAQEKRKALGEKNKKDSETFFAENKTKSGVVTLPSGLQYKIISEGSGTPPKAEDTVSVNYRGTLIDGAEFDRSQADQPASFPVKGVIQGWQEALQLMKPGAKWQLFIPSELAYRELGHGQKIGPNAGLIFEVELVSVKPAAPPPPPPGPITSDIIKVPSAEEMKKGAKIETIKAEDIEKEIAKEKARQPSTNAPK